ncbi:MAG: ABC transporter ATP-binding protein [Brotaphodocola sp.]
MSGKTMGVPPSVQTGGMGHAMMRGKPVVKPKNMKGTLHRLWDMTAGRRVGFIGILVLSAMTSGAGVLSPAVIGAGITAIDHREPAVVIALILFALYAGDALVRFLQQFFMASLAQGIICHIRKSLFDAMLKLPLSFFDRHRYGELMSRLTNDVDNISTTISNSLSVLLTQIFSIIGILCMMLWLSPPLALVALGSVSVVLIVTNIVTKRTRKLYSAQQKILGKLNGHIEESISGFHVVRSFGMEQEMTEEFEAYNEELRKVSTHALIWSGYLMPIMNVINNLNYIILAVISGIMVVHNKIEIGMITSFLLYAKRFSRPFIEIANVYNNFQTAVAGAERIFEIMDEEQEPEDAADALSAQAVRGDIELKDVVFGYLPDTPVLKGISLTIPAGTRTAIVGTTGAGKTTIINLLTRFYDVNEGSILLDGHDLRTYRMRDLRRYFGVVLQDTALFAESVKENIACGRPDATMEQIVAAAEIAGADGFIRRLPQGYDTILVQSGQELSQGERQLITIARAVLADAPILILDEATSSVDTMTEQKIRHAMLQITKGRTSFIIAHRLSTIRDSDMIVLLEDGQIAEQGTHEELMAENGRYAAMYRTQMGMG